MEEKNIQTIVLTGTMSEICAKLAYEARGCNGMYFGNWLELRRHEKRVERWVEQGCKDEK